jgi:endonuclease/exonuclease/phosphatase family metal-dependent hydrolase
MMLTGDFNAKPEINTIMFMRGQKVLSDERVEMTDAYSIMNGPINKTVHGFRGDIEGDPIDYIFVTPEVKVLRVKVEREQIKGGYPSDHYPVIAELQLP